MLEILRPQKDVRKEISFTDDNDDILCEQEKVEAYTLEETKRILEVTRNEPIKWRLYISAKDKGTVLLQRQGDGSSALTKNTNYSTM